MLDSSQTRQHPLLQTDFKLFLFLPLFFLFLFLHLEFIFFLDLYLLNSTHFFMNHLRCHFLISQPDTISSTKKCVCTVTVNVLILRQLRGWSSKIRGSCYSIPSLHLKCSAFWNKLWYIYIGILSYFPHNSGRYLVKVTSLLT